MYHRVYELLDKLDVIHNRAEELRRVREEINFPMTIESNMKSLVERRDYLVDDIQALCRDIAGDTQAKKRPKTNIYSLSSNKITGVSATIVAENHADAIEEMRNRLGDWDGTAAEWTLSLVERVENPEDHNCMDCTGPFHLVFIHRCSFDAAGNMIG